MPFSLRICRPTGEPHALAIRTLERAGYETANLRLKSWDEFSVDSARQLDVVITLCDSAAAEQCPAWFGAPKSAHWGWSDPAAIETPDECLQAFEVTLAIIEQRIDKFLRDWHRFGACPIMASVAEQVAANAELQLWDPVILWTGADNFESRNARFPTIRPEETRKAEPV